VKRWVALVLVPAAVVLAAAGCGGRAGEVAGGTAGTVQAGRSGAALCVPSPAASVAPAPSRAAQRLPDLTLPCLRAGADTPIAHLGTAAIVNLWASWCGPCRQELPAFQRYADRAGDRVLVIGVDTKDRRPAAESLAGELGLRLPMLYDRDGALLAAVGRTALPVTLFVDAGGGIAYLYNAQALDEATLQTLAAQHLGVVLP
jgi:thiol-disulfide isomerase/thioredoxin